MGTMCFLVLVCGIPVHGVISPTGPYLLLVFLLRFWAEILLSQFSSSHRMDRKLGFQSSTFRGILLHLLLLSAARKSLPNSGFPRPLFLSLPQLPQIGVRSGDLGLPSSPSYAV
ncbi:unnamed protein product [Sphagnum balticum]